MTMESTLRTYWSNEAEIAALVTTSGCTVEQIVAAPYNFSNEVVSKLESLLLKKKHLLNVLGLAQKKSLATSSIVDLASYRKLTSFCS